MLINIFFQGKYVNLYYKKMSGDFEWGVKNGDLDKVKEAVEKVCVSYV